MTMPRRTPISSTPVSSREAIAEDARVVREHLRTRAAATAREGEARQRVLVVDDELRLRQVLVRLMTRDGFECHDVGSAEEALAYLEQQSVTLVLSDLRMPGLDGTELLRAIRERWPETAVVMITAVADVEVAVSCLAMGAMDYLTKPFHLEEVRARVRQALERRALLVEKHAYQRQLEARVAEQARRIETLFLASMQSLADALEVKDPYTRGHSERVSRYSVQIAAALGLGRDALEQIELGGHLHDLGKIGVREAVLNKPGPLTREEYAHIMTHPVVGWRLLQPLLVEMPMALTVVRSHHERLDGSGVPDGLAAEAIPLEARIVAVADSFDAMTSHRPYRRGRTAGEAMAELRRCAGEQYDPKVVEALVHALAGGRIALQL
jgi:putative two-component system response regulator